MASAVVPDSKDIPRLALSVDSPASSSPFPSPGSPFFPPPRLGAHEFALRPPPSSPLMRNNIVTKKRDDDSAFVNDDAATTPTQPLLFSLTSPTTPTPASVRHASSPVTPHIAIPEPPASPSLPSPASTRDSLTSSRPAPPSPALSRRASAALSLSRHSSGVRSRRQSRAPQSQSQLQSDAQASTSAAPPAPKRRSLFIKIRDFAFPSADARHAGRGADVPRPNRVRRRGSAASSSSSASDAPADPADDPHAAWGSFRWNTLSTHFSWGGAKAEAQDGPSSTDFERNFIAESPADAGAEPEQDEGADEPEYRSEDGPLAPGVYRAMFAFEPEGTAEMALEEDQVVRVIGRGGGVGWAVVEKEGGGHALVPESYLELVQLDDKNGA